MTLAKASRLQDAAPAQSALAGPLRAVIQDLATPRRRIEAAFLDIGHRLIQANGILSGITASFETLAGGMEEHDATNAFIRSEALARRVLAIIESTTRTTRDLSPLIAGIGVIGRPVADLSRAVKSIGLVALGTRISAAHLSGRGNDFTAFTTDIKRLSERAAVTTSRFMTAYDRLVATLKAAEAKRIALEATENRVMSGLSERLETSLRAVNEHRLKAGAACAEISHLFGRIAAGVSSVVTALQIGDITRQRIEHVEEALALALDPETVLDNPQDGNDTVLIAAVCRLQTALATRASEDFGRELGIVVETIRRLAGDARDIVARSRQIHEETIEGSRATLAGLIDEVRRACALMRKCEADRRELDQAASVVTAALDDLLHCIEAVQDIKTEMHLLGINMALKCSHLGTEGRDLNAIAYEVRELAGKTVIHAQTVVAALDQTAAQAKSLAASPAESAVEDFAMLDKEIGCFRHTPQSADQRMTEALDLLIRDGSHVAKRLDEAAGKITIHDEIGGALRAAVTAIDRIRGDAQAAYANTGRGDIKLAEDRALAKLRSHYTMASERALHDQFAGLPTNSDALPPPAPTGSGECDLDDIFL